MYLLLLKKNMISLRYIRVVNLRHVTNKWFAVGATSDRDGE